MLFLVKIKMSFFTEYGSEMFEQSIWLNFLLTFYSQDFKYVNILYGIS